MDLGEANKVWWIEVAHIYDFHEKKGDCWALVKVLALHSAAKVLFEHLNHKEPIIFNNPQYT